jgi:3-methyl-2-oxobutanoate hydroxymethyltransferase
MPRLTIKELRAAKGSRHFTQLFVRTADEAHAAHEAGIELLVAAERLEGQTFDLAAIRAAAPDCFITFGLPLRGLSGSIEVLREAYRLMDFGGDAVYCPYSFATVEALAAEFIPVVGHVGLVPFRSSWTGGMRAVGTNAVEAVKVWEHTRRFQDAGAIAVEMEVVPREVAAEISRRTNMLVIGLGSGSGCDVQYLFSTDVLGDNQGHVPRHSKVYRDFAAEYARLQLERVAAFREFHDEVASGSFPAVGQEVLMKPDELAAFLHTIGEG